jgi:hypothetical protein
MKRNNQGFNILYLIPISYFLLYSEKQDGKEKESEEKIPPLPQKKRGHIASSKQEKEVENLTEKQRSIIEKSTVSMAYKPRIAKLKALFERSPATRESRSSQSKHRHSQQVSRSHSLGAVRVKADSQEDQVVVKAEGHREVNASSPVFCYASVDVPQSSTIQRSSPNFRPTLPVKRSKSLKVLGSNQHCKLSLASVVSPITPLNTSDNTVSKQANSPAVKPTDRILLSRGESASNLKPLVPTKKFLTSRSKEVSINESDIDSSRSSKQDDELLTSQAHLDWINCYEGNHVVPRRRRSLESVNFEDEAVQRGSGLDGCELVLPPPQQSKLTAGVACKVLQGCRDYLVSNVKCNVSCDQPEKKVQNSEATDSLMLEAQRKVNAIVAGLGVRERRNSFRQAVGTGREGEVKSDGKLREYEAIWPSGNIVAPPMNGSNVQIENFSSGPYVNVISINSSTAGSDVMHFKLQQTRGTSGNRLQTRPSQDSIGDQLQDSDERKCAPFPSGLIKSSVSHIKGLPREGLEPKKNINMYVKVDNSNARVGKLGAQPKHILRSKMLSPDRMRVHHSHMGTDPKLSANKSTSNGFSLSVDDSNDFQSLSSCKLTGQAPKSAALRPRNLKNIPNSKFVNVKALSAQESSLQTAVDQELRTCFCAGMTAVADKIPVKEVSYKCSPSSVPCHRNATELVVRHGPSPRIGNAVQSRYKSGLSGGDAISRPTEVNSSSHIAAPFIQPKKQCSMQEVSYGMYYIFTTRFLLTNLHVNVLSVLYKEVTVFVIVQLCQALISEEMYRVIQKACCYRMLCFILKAVLML